MIGSRQKLDASGSGNEELEVGVYVALTVSVLRGFPDSHGRASAIWAAEAGFNGDYWLFLKKRHMDTSVLHLDLVTLLKL